MQTYKKYKFDIIKNTDLDKFYYKLYINKKNIIKSNELFDTKHETYFAAIGHITLLEKGEK